MVYVANIPVMSILDLSKLSLEVKRTGLFLFDGDLSITSLAYRLGRPVASAPERPMIDVLTPSVSAHARPGSLSSKYGTGGFPFHTETAHWRRPVDWVILRCVGPGAGDRVTELVDGWGLDLRDRELTALSRSLMVVKNGSKSFLAAPIDNGIYGRIFRYDSACMSPAFRDAELAISILENRLNDADRRIVQWKTGRTLVFDNSRMLHSRGTATTLDTDRILERIYLVR